jgi:prepilin-type N-terminal cleavage/methylation domain-containing protein
MGTNNKNFRKGFTLVELLITIAIFSVTMLMASFVIIGISRTYQKATYTAQLSEAGRSIQQELYKGIAYQGGVTAGVKNGFSYLCSGKNVYFWQKQSGDNPTEHKGLYKKIISDINCDDAIPVDPNADSSVANLLPTGGVSGFVTTFDIVPVRTNDTECQFGCNINLTLKIGTPDMFVDGSVDNLCLDTLKGGDYCSEVSYNSFVRSKVGY